MCHSFEKISQRHALLPTSLAAPTFFFVVEGAFGVFTSLSGLRQIQVVDNGTRRRQVAIAQGAAR